MHAPPIWEKLLLMVRPQVFGVRLVLINDLNGRAAPLMATSLRPLTLSGSGTFAHFEVGGEVGLAVDMRNAGMSIWEPLLGASRPL